MTEVVTEFRSAVQVARHALEQFNAEPLVESKRGGPRLSPWWRVYKEASEVAQRWHRQLEQETKSQQSIDDTIDRLLSDDA